ncbi:MAG TPA: hypothetical protein VK054_05130, partial [Beutenbergiaceae bacterium]|nr:hypothetical protein [Beutenbergiaceae bacterium]
ELNDTWNTVRVGWVAPSEGEIPAGTEIVLSDGFTVMKGPRAPLLVSTQFSPDPDLEPRERSGGGAELVGRSPARVGNNTSTRRAVISEEVRSPLGTNSMKQIVPEVDTGTTLYGNTFVGSTGGLQGRTITAVAWCYIPDGYDDSDDVALGSANRIARTLYAYSGGTGSLDNGYAQAPATPGWHLVRAHISLPEDVSDNAIRVTPSYKVNQPIYWSNVTIVDDPSYSGPPFSGNTPDEGPLWLTGTGNSGCKIVGNPTWVANSGVNGGQIGYAATLKEVGD